MINEQKPHIILIIARGEAVRNFVFSGLLKVLSMHARITILTSIKQGELVQFSKPYSDSIIQFDKHRENPIVVLFREIIHTAHYQWLWSKAVKYYWGRHNDRVKGNIRKTIRLYVWRIFGIFFSFRPMLRLGTLFERWLSVYLRPTRYFDKLFEELKPDLIFNCSHIHGTMADLPMRVASHMGIPSSVFIFSWDNLTSRSRIFPPYDHYLVWNKKMAQQLFALYYPEISTQKIHITGTPQFDFHFNPKFQWKKEKLYNEIGLDIHRPYILYTTGMASDFQDEHRILNEIIKYLKEMEKSQRPQMVVRTYIKGTSKEMLKIANSYKNDSDIFFPPVLWDPVWIMPMSQDLYIYSNLLQYASLGINAASTVSLELMMFNKPTINIGFEPPGSNLPHWSKFSRHVKYEHYEPVVSSGGVMVARSMEELKDFIIRGLENPDENKVRQDNFIFDMFDHSIQLSAANRVSKVLLKIIKMHSSV